MIATYICWHNDWACEQLLGDIIGCFENEESFAGLADLHVEWDDMRSGKIVRHFDNDALLSRSQDLQLAEADMKGGRREGDLAGVVYASDNNDIDSSRERRRVYPRV